MLVLSEWLRRLWLPLDEWGFGICVRMVLGVFCVFAMLIAFWGVAKIHVTEQDLQIRNDEFMHQARQTALLTKKRKEQVAQVRQFSRSLDTIAHVKNWLEMVQKRLRHHHLMLQELTNKPPERLPFYIKHPFCLRAEGRYHDIKAWFWSTHSYASAILQSVQLQGVAKQRVRMEVCGVYFQKR